MEVATGSLEQKFKGWGRMKVLCKKTSDGFFSIEIAKARVVTQLFGPHSWFLKFKSEDLSEGFAMEANSQATKTMSENSIEIFIVKMGACGARVSVDVRQLKRSSNETPQYKSALLTQALAPKASPEECIEI